ncbi:MAG: hypothetical protein Fur0022_15280 [Anaerolineales bacterium]
MKSKFQVANILSVLVILAMLIAPVSTVSFAASPEKAQPPQDDGPASPKLETDSPTGLYIVRLKDASLAAYTGGVAGYEATNPIVTGRTYVDVSAPESIAYLDYLAGKQAEVIAAMEQALGRSVEVRYQYLNVLNGMAVAMSAAEAARVSKLPGVISVTPDKLEQMTTDVGPTWIGAPAIWNGATIDGASAKGEGVIVAVLDSGINHDNPSFAEVGGDGYVHVNPYGSGVYAPGSHCISNPSFCNDKLIGAWDFHPTALGPEDTDGHGSHTASTAAGNVVSATIVAPTLSITDTISGVAPHANIIAYKVCEPSCPQSSSVAAVNQAITDRSNAGGVPMALNFSISGSDAPWDDVVDLAFLDAFNAGIYVSASAGNNGPGASTVAHTGPWNATTAASTHNRALIEYLQGMVGGNTTPPADIQGAGFTAPYSAHEIVYAGDFGDALCLNPFPPGTWTNGEIVICDRGTNARVQKGANVLAGGAGGYVLANDIGNGNSIVADPHFLPAVHIGYNDGVTLKTWVADGGTSHVGAISGTIVDYSASNGDVLAGFSSRGPSQYDLMAPDNTAPGVSVWAAYCCGDEYQFLSGTSMSSPHNAGSGALMLSLHPTWSPAEVLSALSLTAHTNPAPLGAGATIFKEDGVTPADWMDMGNGRVDLSGAAMSGLVMDETGANFLAADPGLGGDPRTLNLPSIMDWNCVGTCVFTRTVTSPLNFDVDWTVTSEVPAGMTITASPSSFTLPAGGSQEIVFTVDASGSPVADWQFANIILTPSEPIAAAEAPVYTAPAFNNPLPDSAMETVDEAGAEAPSVVSPLSDFRVPNAVLYDNGPLVTHPGAGAGGADESRLQSTSLGMTTLGFGHQVSANNRVADDFTITDPGGWDIDNIIFYAYQTGSTTASTITEVNVQIWDGPPNAGGTVIWGDTSTNVMTDTVWTNIYRVTETTIGNTQRPIMANTVAVGGLHLDPGTYWIDWQSNGSLASGPWAPPVTILGQTTTGNGLQSIAGVWGAALDGGTSTPQGFPFTVLGTVSPLTATYCSAPNLPIPDSGATSDSLVVGGSGTILDVNVGITGTHTWVGDLIFTLSSSSASSVVIDRPGYTGTGFGCSANDIAVLLDDEGVDGPVENQCSATPPALFGNPTPNNPLSVFDTTELNDTWTLTVSDNAGGDTGTLQEWCITVEYLPGAPSYVEPATSHLAVAVYNPGTPTIAVTPSTLESTQGINQTVTQTLTISNTGSGNLDWSIFEDADAPSGLWSDNFDSYPTGQNLHGVGGWKGWNNDPGATAFTTAAQALSAPNSVDIVGAADLVHEYAGATAGQWTYTAWQYIPSTMTGQSYFIILNTYADNGAQNWSVQVTFDGATNQVTNTGVSGGTLTLIEDQWVEIRVEIDLDANTQDFYYNNQLLYSGTWTEEVSGGGALNIGAVDLFANNATSVYYDDLSLTGTVPPPSTCDFPGNIDWLSVSPTSGTTVGPGATDVTVTYDSTGLSLGVYTGTLCVESNDVTNPLVVVPVTLTIDTLPPVIEVAPDALANTQGPDLVTTWDLVISNTGEADLDWTIDEDAIPNVLYSTVTIPSAPAGSITIGDGPFSLSTSGLSGSASHSLNAPAGLTTITHSNTQNITALNSVSCNAGGLHADNSYVRSFTLADFGITDSFSVTEVSFGIEEAAGAGGDQPVVVNLYTWNPSDPFIFANFTLVGSSSVNVPDQTLSIYTVPVTGTISAGGTLVVEIFTPDGQTEGNSFFIGSNADGQTAPSYIAAADCGISNPIDLAVIGFPNMHIVMNVTGEIVPAAGVCVNPEDIAWASVSPTSGTTAGGAASTVEVTFDSTGLSAGVYTGTLCIESNDLTNPLVTVPLTLTVDESADLWITKSAPSDAVVGETFTYTLEVTNAGPATALSTTVTDTLPAGVTFVSATAGCTEAAGVVTCALGDVAPGATVTVEIVVTADEAGLVTNTAEVASASPDPDPSNNSASADTNIAEAPVEEYWIFLPLISKN